MGGYDRKGRKYKHEINETDKKLKSLLKQLSLLELRIGEPDGLRDLFNLQPETNSNGNNVIKQETCEIEAENSSIVCESPKGDWKNHFFDIREKFKLDKKQALKNHIQTFIYNKFSWFKVLYGLKRQEFKKRLKNKNLLPIPPTEKYIHLKQYQLIKCLDFHIKWIQDPIFIGFMPTCIFWLLVGVKVPISKHTRNILQSLVKELILIEGKRKEMAEKDIKRVNICIMVIYLFLNNMVE